MSFGERLKEARLLKGYTQKQLAEKLDIGSTTVTGYEKDNSEPNMATISKIIHVLGVDANFLLQDEIPKLIYDDKATPEEFENIVKKYRALDDYGRETVDFILNRETERVASLRKQGERIKELERSQNTVIEFNGQPDVPARYIQYYRKVSAGTGEVIYEDVAPERITIPDIPKYRRVAYAVKVSGKSMEPLYDDGDMLLIEPTCIVDVGEIGIFNVDGKAYVKKRGETELISLNKDYKNVPLTDESRCMGRVIDKFKGDCL